MVQTYSPCLAADHACGFTVQGDFRYQPVLMHERATSIHRTHSNANTYLEVFDVKGHPGGELDAPVLRQALYCSL